MSMLTYFRTAELPEIKLWLEDEDGNLIDLSAHTVTFKLGSVGSAAVLTKAATGAAGSGTEDSGTANCTIAFSAGELDNVAAGPYAWQIKATIGSLDRFWQGTFELRDVIT